MPYRSSDRLSPPDLDDVWRGGVDDASDGWQDYLDRLYRSGRDEGPSDSVSRDFEEPLS